MSSALGSPYGPHALVPLEGVRALQFLAAWVGTAWAWALFAFAVGWLFDRWRTAVLGGVVGLLAAVVAYYGCDALIGVNQGLSSVEIVFWSLVALVVGPVMSAAGWLARRSSPWSVFAGLAAPGVMAVDTLLRPSGPDSIRPCAQWFVYLAAAALTMALVLRAARIARRRHST